MRYVNAKDILPDHLLCELQSRAGGELVYVPKKSVKRAGWGEVNGSRESYRARNDQIRLLFENGKSVRDIALKYHLSEDSIKKLLKRSRHTGTQQ